MLDIQQHGVVVIVPRDCICRQGWADIRHNVVITRKRKTDQRSRRHIARWLFLVINGIIYIPGCLHLRAGDSQCRSDREFHCAGLVHWIESTGSSLSRTVSERVTGPVAGSEPRWNRRIGKHALTHSADVSRGGMHAKGYMVSAYQNRSFRRIVTIRNCVGRHYLTHFPALSCFRTEP